MANTTQFIVTAKHTLHDNVRLAFIVDITKMADGNNITIKDLVGEERVSEWEIIDTSPVRVKRERKPKVKKARAT